MRVIGNGPHNFEPRLGDVDYIRGTFLFKLQHHANRKILSSTDLTRINPLHGSQRALLAGISSNSFSSHEKLFETVVMATGQESLQKFAGKKKKCSEYV
ncbi:hypothetical protein TNCV_4082901 [Trichonephila clavipes]|nr:hypothetical protein TNCV_4082901 [Trichonephila clavipes]